MTDMTLNLGDVVVPLELELRSGREVLGVAAADGLRMADSLALASAVVAAVGERVRQLTDKGMTSALDAKYTRGQLAAGASCYLAAAVMLNDGAQLAAWETVTAMDGWPADWSPDMFKPWDSDSNSPVNDQLRCLDKAMAMIMAERQRVAALKADDEACAAQERRDEGR